MIAKKGLFVNEHNLFLKRSRMTMFAFFPEGDEDRRLFSATANDCKFQFIELLLEMQNEECAVQNECIFFENDFNQSAKPTPLFYILHSAFCIAQPKLRDKLEFTMQRKLPGHGVTGEGVCFSKWLMLFSGAPAARRLR